MIKRAVAQKYRIQVVSNDSEGIMALLLCNKISDTTILLIGFFLPPESSAFGRQVEYAFENVTNLLF